MPNDIVYHGPSPDDDPENINRRETNSEEWDLPPEAMGYGPRADEAGPARPPEIRGAAWDAAHDAAQARQEGDIEFASVRESDAGELVQTRWDWGDARTWLWFAAMFFGFLLLVALCYFLPEGRHASPPPIRVY